MKSKYSLLLALQSFDYEITRLCSYAKECEDCYELLQVKLDDLCRYIMCEGNDLVWKRWGEHPEIRRHGEQLRSTSNQALCELEKHQSMRLLERKESLTEYLAMLSASVKRELRDYELHSGSRVLFVGSGALPLSALTIARETGAEVLCLDIDEEAVRIGSMVAEAGGLRDRVRFSGSYVEGLAFAEQATHVIVASLVESKHEVLKTFRPAIRSDAAVILRYGHGLKSVFNYPLDGDFGTDWHTASFGRSDCVYDTVMLKAKSGGRSEVRSG
ncbi:hypothetical protein KP806_16405 [Paenibacillus sp. N4]|uniref:nicotianamine synthase family protein n=1 Tax=Paenibacillus vietnamensis TaxID=2590547 RepID=UPI001CD08157|nr:nicotianamine synthase family protein [Paenibacillus vietnamensis]MCA0756639.1 hypothetical protein [Paenibacillus vietnamensis]